MRNFFRRFRKGPPDPLPDEELDEYGFPWAWHRDPVEEWYIRESEAHWPIFEQWCAARGERAFPASRETVLAFLREAPVEGETLRRTWEAIDMRHEAHYWHTDANPVTMLAHRHTRQPVEVTHDGSVTIPDDIMKFERWGYTFDGVYQDPDYLQARAGVYVVWCLVVNHAGSMWRVLEIGEADNVRGALIESEQGGCWKSNCQGVVYFGALYRTEDFRPSPRELLPHIRREQDSVPCSQPERRE